MKKDEIIQKFVNIKKDSITLNEVIEKTGDRSCGLILLIFSIINVLFLPDFSGLPLIVGIPSMILCAQYAFKKEKIFIPGFLLRKELKKEKVLKMINFIYKIKLPIKEREFKFDSRKITGLLSFLTCILTSLPIPLLPAIPSLLMVLYSMAILENDKKTIFICNLISIPIIILFIISLHKIIIYI